MPHRLSVPTETTETRPALTAAILLRVDREDDTTLFAAGETVVVTKGNGCGRYRYHAATEPSRWGWVYDDNLDGLSPEAALLAPA